jgi:cytochrome c oxidase subunit 1
MSATLTPVPVVQANPQSSSTVGVTRNSTRGNVIVRWLTSTDHKIIGHMYVITALVYFVIGGIMALIIRMQLV